MSKFSLIRHGSACPVGLPGDTIADAVTHGMKTIARELNIGNAAGYAVKNITAEYKPGIIGRKGGVEVVILATNLKLAHQSAEVEPRRYVAWIEARPEDLPEPVTLFSAP